MPTPQTAMIRILTLAALPALLAACAGPGTPPIDRAKGPPPTPPPTAAPLPTSTPTVNPVAACTPSWPFACRVEMRTSPDPAPRCTVAGRVEDLDGSPLPGYHVAVTCPGADRVILRAGDDPAVNEWYGSPAAWEHPCPAGEVRVQLFDDQPGSDGYYDAVSGIVVARLPGPAGETLAHVACTLTWEGFR